MTNKIDFSNIGIDNVYMFGYLMQNPKLCKPFLEQILNIKIDRIEYLDKEKDIKNGVAAHGIRLDIYAEDEKAVYNCEMQTVNTRNLPKRKDCILFSIFTYISYYFCGLYR